MGNSKKMHDKYLPFAENIVKKHLYGRKTNDEIEKSRSQEKQLEKIRGSIANFEEYKKKYISLEGILLDDLRSPCQVQRDERFWTMNTLLSIFYSPNRKKELVKLFEKGYRQNILKSFGLHSWEDCFSSKDLQLFFEVYLSPPAEYIDSLSQAYSISREKKSPNKYQIIPYILASAFRKKNSKNSKQNGKITIPPKERSTHVDAMIINPDNGFGVVIEAKVLSDISIDTSFNLLRNQLARTIDVMLEANKDMYFPFNKRDPGKTIFLLLTPEIFRNNPLTRLYDYKMRDYKDPEKGVDYLKEDLPHRTKESLKDIPSRIGWLTWEDFKKEVNSQCPPWDIDYDTYF